MLRSDLLLIAIVLTGGCGSSSSGTPDAGAPLDASQTDGGAGVDASIADAMIADAMPADDAGPPDATPSFALSVTAGASGAITSDVGGIDCDDAGAPVCQQDFDPGTVVTLTAEPAVGFAFDSWSGDCAGSAAITTVTLDADRSCTAAFVGVQGDIQLIPPPLSVVPNATEDDDDVLMFVERSDYALPQDVVIDLHVPSTYDTQDLSVATIPAGTRVNVYFMHYDPVSSSTTKTGTATFATQVVGIISSTARLDATDAILGSTAVLYPSTGTDRQYELTNQDAVGLSGDRRSVSIDVATSTSADQLRIIALAAGETLPVLSTNVVEESIPATIEAGMAELGGAARLYPERSGEILGQDLAVDTTAPRFYTAAGQLAGGTITMGTRVSSYLIHFDPPGTASAIIELCHTFDRPILGLVFVSATLTATDPLVGATTTTYPADDTRELELTGDDRVRFGDDGKSLSLRLLANVGVDQLRVIVAD